MTAPAVDGRELMHPEAIMAWRQRRAEIFERIFEPPELLALSAWGERFFRLSPESSGEPGPLNLERTPYLREVLDELSNPLTEEVVFRKPARIGGTVVGNVWLANCIVDDPAPMMLVLPTLEMAKAWSKEQFAPMLRDVPCLQGRVADARSRDSGNTMLQKMFPGGSMTVGGSNSPSLFRMRTVRRLWASDVDDPNFVKNPEGDTIELARNRMATFSGSKGYYESSPGHALTSRIIPLYEKGDQRQLYVPCPHCRHYQVLAWKNLRYKEVTQPVYICANCEQPIPEELKYRMLLQHEWRPHAEFRGVASFWMNALYSPFPGTTWPKLVEKWVDAQSDNSKLHTFVNTVLADPWEERGGKIAEGGLYDRRQAYGAEVPMPVRLLVCTADVQHEWIEYKVKGYGPGMSSCLIAHGQIRGVPVQQDVWAEFDQVRARVFTKADGTAMKIAGTGIDTGDGTYSSEVYAYVQRHRGRRVFALKGSSNPAAPPLPRRPTHNNKGRVPLWVIGVNALKSTVFGRLKLTQPGPGYMWFPDWATPEYFKGLTSEAPRPKFINGRMRIEWYHRPGDRNEPWDLEVYGLAVVKILGQEMNLMSLPWQDWIFGPPPEGDGSPPPKPDEPRPPKPRRPVRGDEDGQEDEEPDSSGETGRRRRARSRSQYLRDW